MMYYGSVIVCTCFAVIWTVVQYKSKETPQLIGLFSPNLVIANFMQALSLWANWLVTKFGLNSLKRYLWPVLYVLIRWFGWPRNECTRSRVSYIAQIWTHVSMRVDILQFRWPLIPDSRSGKMLYTYWISLKITKIGYQNLAVDSLRYGLEWNHIFNNGKKKKHVL